MAEGGVIEDVATLVEGCAVKQTIEGGTINVIAGNQTDGTKESIHKSPQNFAKTQATAMLAEGENVDQRFTNCEINVVAGDQTHIHGDVKHVYNICHGPNDCDGEKSITGNPRDNSHFVRWWEKFTGMNLTSFKRKINEHSRNNIQGKVTQNYEDLPEPVKEYYPRMKTGFKLFKGDYVPLDGFSAHCRPKSGDYINFERCCKIVTERRGQPCVIIGQPGSGKTTTMKRLARTFLTGNQFRLVRALRRRFRRNNSPRERVDYNVVLHMNVRDIPNTDSGTLADIVFSPSVTGLTKLEAQFGLESILEKKTKIIMFFDGLDQAMWEPSCDKKIGPWERASTATIFGNILAGNLLSEVPITVSSREHSVAGLELSMRPPFIAALVGFSEDDARALYCEIMGDGAEYDWNSMRISNPAMHYMCLTPVFLIFYMITRKANRKDPPDCATGVMVCIIQMFLECENARKIDHNTKIFELLNDLKKMAFQGTKEQRVVFLEEDLKQFNLTYEVISDLIIKVPGLSILGQKILQGMFRFFFSHQTLQEILSALRVVELDYTEFTQVVDEEFPKPYWSVVRSFTCGILKNKGIGNRIATIILKPLSDLTKKSEYLMTHLKRQVLCDGSPANKLETLVALREANALDVLRGFAEDLDFSNIPLTPAMINTLCSVMKYIGSVRRLSLANSGMDSGLLEVLAKGTNGLGIKVVELDIRGNDMQNGGLDWRPIFQNMTISRCFISTPSNEQTGVDVEILQEKIEVLSFCVGQLHVEEVEKMQLDMTQFIELAEFDRVVMTVNALYIEINSAFNVWRKIVKKINFTVRHCYLVNAMLNEKAQVDGLIALTKEVGNVKKVSLTLTKSISITITQLASISNLICDGKIEELHIRPEPKSFQVDIWRQAFQQTSLTVQHCFIVNPVPNEEGIVDLDEWIAALKAAQVQNVKAVSLTSNDRISLTIRRFASIIEKIRQWRKSPLVIDKFYVRPDSESFNFDTWREIFRRMTFILGHCIVENPLPNEEGIVDVDTWIAASRAAQVESVKKVSFASDKITLSISNATSNNDSEFDGEISELYITPNVEYFKIDEWRKTFQRMTLTVQHCVIGNPLPSKEGKVDTDVWAAVAKAADVVNVNKVSLTSKKILMTISEVNDSEFDGKIRRLKLRGGDLTDEDWKQFGEITRKLDATELSYAGDCLLALRYFVDGHGNLKVKKIRIFRGLKLHLSRANVECDPNSQTVQSLTVELDIYQLQRRTNDIGHLISVSDPNDNEVVISLTIDTFVNIDEFASGLDGFKIKDLAVEGHEKIAIVALVEKCHVENLYLHDDSSKVREKLQQYTNVTVLPSGEWRGRFGHYEYDC